MTRSPGGEGGYCIRRKPCQGGGEVSHCVRRKPCPGGGDYCMYKEETLTGKERGRIVCEDDMLQLNCLAAATITAWDTPGGRDD